MGIEMALGRPVDIAINHDPDAILMHKTNHPEGSKGLYRKDLARSPGEAMIRYKDGTMTIKAAKLVIDGTVTVSGDVTAGGVSLDNHTHTDSMGGGTSGPS